MLNLNYRINRMRNHNALETESVVVRAKMQAYLEEFGV